MTNAKDENTRTELINFRDTAVKSDDSGNPSLSDMDNGNEKSSNRPRSHHRPVFTKSEPKCATTSPSATGGLSLLQIYMRQKSQTSMERDTKKTTDDVIASGGGEGWVEDYPSSADEKLGLGSISSSLADVDDENDDGGDSDEDDLCENVRSLTLTDISDIEQTSIQIDAVPFNSAGDDQQHSPGSVASSSLDKLIAKIKPFELGLSPASIEEHWNFENRLQRAAAATTTAQDKSCQATIHPPSSATHEESTSTDPVKPEAYVIFPSYSLPDLSFLKKHDFTWIGDVLLSPQNLPPPPSRPPPQPPQRSFEELKKRQLGHVKDWESLKILLPEEIRQQINSAKPMRSGQNIRPRPKSCEHTVVLRDSKKTTTAQRPSSLRATSARVSDAGLILPTVPHSPTESKSPPPLPKRTASLPQSPAPLRQRRQVTLPTTDKTPSPVRPANISRPISGFTMRKTVSFGEHLSGGYLKMASQKRPLSLSHWSGGSSFEIDSPEVDTRSTSINLEQKEGTELFN